MLQYLVISILRKTAWRETGRKTTGGERDPADHCTSVLQSCFSNPGRSCKTVFLWSNMSISSCGSTETDDLSPRLLPAEQKMQSHIGDSKPEERQEDKKIGKQAGRQTEKRTERRESEERKREGEESKEGGGRACECVRGWASVQVSGWSGELLRWAGAALRPGSLACTVAGLAHYSRHRTSMHAESQQIEAT